MIAALVAGAFAGAVILGIPWLTILSVNELFGAQIPVNGRTWLAMAWLVAVIQAAGRSNPKQ